MPRVPSGAPSGRAVTANWSASATEQNHFSPCSRQASPSAHGTREVRAHVRPAVLLGEELRPALTGVVVGLQQRRQEAFAQLVGTVQPERADQPGRARDRARVAALSRVREQEEEPGLLERLGAEDPRRPDGAPGLRVRRVEPHARAVRRRPVALQRVHERVDLLRDDGAELDEPRRVSEPPFEIGTPEGLHGANVRVSL